MSNAPQHPHVKIGDYYYLVDLDAEVPFRRIYESLMQPRTDVSGVPGAINLQRDVWLWTMTDFAGGEGREVFDSSDPLGPPTFWKSDGGVDTRIRGEFSLHPDEKLITNETGGSGAITTTSWTNTDLSTLAGTPTFSAGPGGVHIRLDPSDSVQTPDRTPGAIPTRVWARVVNARCKASNKKVTVQLRIRNTTDGTNVTTVSRDLRDNEPATLQHTWTPTAGKTYRYYVECSEAGSGVTIDVKAVKETTAATTIPPNDVRNIALGPDGKPWALVWDGTNTDILRWDFTNDDWDMLDADLVASQPLYMAASDTYMYTVCANGVVYRTDTSGSSITYASAPSTLSTTTYGIAVGDNKLWVLRANGLHKITLDGAGSYTEGDSNYTIVVEDGVLPEEGSSATQNNRQAITGIANGVRFFRNMMGSQSVIYEYNNTDAACPARWMLPAGYKATAIHHYANISFIAASFTNSASEPAQSRAGIFYIGSDDLLRFIGYLRFSETNSQPVAFIDSYGHDVYFMQGRRRWRYSLGSGGYTLENMASCDDETLARAMCSMDKKFWMAYATEGCFVADDTYPTTTMWLYSPVWDYDLPDLQKVLLSFDIITAPLPSNTRLDLEYRTDEADAWTAAGSVTTAAAVKSRITISSSSSTTKFTTLQWRIGLTSTDGVDTPRVRSVTARAYVLDYESGFDMTLLLDDDTPTDRGRWEQKSGRQKSSALWTMIGNKNLVAFEDHFSSTLPTDYDTYTVVLEDPWQHINERGQSAMRLRAKVV